MMLEVPKQQDPEESFLKLSTSHAPGFFSWYLPTIFFVTQQTPQLRAGDPQAYPQEVLIAACVKLCHVFSITF